MIKKLLLIAAIAMLGVSAPVQADPPPEFWVFNNVNLDNCSGPNGQQTYTAFAAAQTSTPSGATRVRVYISENSTPDPATDILFAELYNGGAPLSTTTIYKSVPPAHYCKYLHSTATWQSGDTASSFITEGSKYIPEGGPCGGGGGW